MLAHNNPATHMCMHACMQAPAKVLNTRNREGETVLGWLLKFNASGLMKDAETVELAGLLLDKGALATLKAFKEQVCVRACVRVCVCVCVRGCVRACVRACGGGR